MSNLRTIVVETDAQADLEAIGDLHRIDDAIAALSGAFDQQPARYPKTDGAGDLRVAPFTFYDGAPPVRIAFEVSENELVIVAVSVDPVQMNGEI